MLDAGAAAVWRRERALRTIARLRAEIAAWTHAFADPAHASQLAAVTTTLAALTDGLATSAAAIGDTAAAIADAARVEHDATVVERVWRYYAARFGQRRGPDAAPLAIADELIWSCTAIGRAVFAADLPYPLAYVEPAFSASALPREARPRDLAPIDRALAAVLRAMPVPLIALPTAFAAEPWWMILIAHEVGHLVQFEAEPDDEVGVRTRAVLETAGGATWGDWQREVFADAFAVAAVGAATIRAFAELEWGTDAELRAPRATYPPVATRLAIMTEVGRALGLPVDDDLVPETTDRAAARALAPALTAMPIGSGSLATLAAACGSATDDDACTKVLAGQALGLTPGRGRPLRAIGAAFRAYARLSAPPACAPAALDGLAARIGPLITTVRDTEVRRAVAPPRRDHARLARLTRALRAGDAP